MISDIKVISENGYKELSGLINGYKIYFRVPEKFELYPMAECFLGAALLDAMASNSTVVIDSSIPISKALYQRLSDIQSIYSCWNRDLSIVDVEAKLTDVVHPFESIGSFFSAGVDSSHTLLRNNKEITHLIMFRGFDRGDDDESWSKRVLKQTQFAETQGKTLIPVDTNFKTWTQSRKIAWEFVHGLFISSAGGAFGMKRIYVPSSHTYAELFPWGSHPLSDPMWSTESTRVIHDGAGYLRSEKIKELLKEPVFADNLQVCWNSTLSNCGKCPKCVRTKVAVALLGAEIQSMPALSGIAELKDLKATDERAAFHLEDAMALAKEAGRDDYYKVLRGYYRRYQLGLIPPMLDRYLFGNFFRNGYRKIKKPDWLNAVTLRGSRWSDW